MKSRPLLIIRQRWFSSFFLLALGMVVLLLRNADPVLHPVLYAEDGGWLSLAIEHGWGHVFWRARPDYFVWGNLLLIRAAAGTSAVLCGDMLGCYAEALAGFSYAFYSGLAVVAFAATRGVLSRGVRWILFAAVLLLPYGDSSNEILGRALNIGFHCVFLAALLLFWRERLGGWPRRMADGVIVLCAGTNPVCLPLIFGVLLAPACRRGRAALVERISTNWLLLSGSASIALAIISRVETVVPGQGGGVEGASNLVEVVLARASFYPFLFFFYERLSDTIVVAITALLSLLLVCFWRCADPGEWRRLLGIVLTAFVIFLCFLTLGRQSAYAAFGGYRTTFPDRYFVGVNVLALCALVVAAGGAWQSRRGAVKWLAGITFGVLILVYGVNLPWLLERDTPRYLIASGRNFAEEACLSSMLVPPSSEDGVKLPIYPAGWSIEVPGTLIRPLTEGATCNAYRKRFFETDGRWEGGIARSTAAFVTPDSPTYAIVFAPGQQVALNGADLRQVLSREQHGDRFIITLDGGVLPQVGVPALLAGMSFPRLPQYSTTAFNLTWQGWFLGQAQDWAAGIARHEAGLLLPYGQANLRTFHPGAVVRFANGEQRRIVRAQGIPHVHLVWVSLEGVPLDPIATGFPHRLEIIE